MSLDPLHCRYHCCWLLWWWLAIYTYSDLGKKKIVQIVYSNRANRTVLLCCTLHKCSIGEAVGGRFIHLTIVSTSMPEKPKALSPSIHTTLWTLFCVCSKTAAAMANPGPTPIVPNVPASNLYRTFRSDSDSFRFCSEQHHTGSTQL